jgi:hypothetical protein
MTAQPDSAAMRTHVLVAVAVSFCAACASPPPAPCVDTRGECAQEPVPRPSVGALTVRVFEVGDLVTPPGDPSRVADLASNIYADVTFLVGNVDSTVDVQGTSIVMKSTPHVLARVANHLARKRAGVTPNGL